MVNTGRNRRDFLKLAGGAWAVAALPSYVEGSPPVPKSPADDLLVTPTVPVLRVLIAEARDDQASVALYARNTRPFNAYGLPTVSVPCGFSKSGLPIGLQIAGPPWGEESIIRLAYAYEQATDWHARRPVL
jgi:Asp-tRNA(Asn)/Glu-tRNA(Gln) amidotransferase A subunit family amidase